MRRLLITILLGAVCVPGLCQFSAPPAVPMIGSSHGFVELGWYASSDAYEYLADVNMNFDIGSWHEVKFNAGGGILTLITMTEADSFQPDRYRGTIQPAAYLQRGDNVYSFAIRHQSFHTIDRPRPLGETYELYMLAYQRLGAPNVTVSIGKYLNRADVDYDWDLFLNVDTACFGSCRFGRIYTSATVHYVDEDGSLSGGRDSFLDYGLELGIQSREGVRYFGAIRKVHDIDQFNGIADDQLLFGIKYLW